MRLSRVMMHADSQMPADQSHGRTARGSDRCLLFETVLPRRTLPGDADRLNWTQVDPGVERPQTTWRFTPSKLVALYLFEITPGRRIDEVLHARYPRQIDKGFPYDPLQPHIRTLRAHREPSASHAGRSVVSLCQHSAVHTLWQIGAFLSPYVWGVTKDATGSFRAALIGASVVVVVEALVILYVRARVMSERRLRAAAIEQPLAVPS
jgi:hypothetical protein